MRNFINMINEAGRAKVGGESGINGFTYKGGQFLPSTNAPPGTWRVKQNGKNKLVSTKKWLIAPGKSEESPSPYARGIFQIMAQIVDVDKSGVVSVKDNPIAVEYYGRGMCDGRYDVEELVEMYNKGMRWVEVIPSDVEIIAKS